VLAASRPVIYLVGLPTLGYLKTGSRAVKPNGAREAANAGQKLGDEGASESVIFCNPA
jgi:hypothetical protein